jgi:hypothetical protein
VSLLLPSVARQLPILDVTWRSCFFVPSLRPSYIGETVLNPCQFVGCKDYSEIVVSSSTELVSRAFDDSLFLFDFDSILFILYCARMISSQDFSYELNIYMPETIDNILNNSGKDSFISFWWYTWRHLYLDLLFSVRYIPQEFKQYDFMILYKESKCTFSLFVCVAMCQGNEFIYSVHSRCQCAFSMF